MRLTTLDLISVIMDRPARPLDFTIVLHFQSLPNGEGLEAGARSARLEFPQTGAILDGVTWRPSAAEAAIGSRTVARSDVQRTLEDFVDGSWDLSQQPPVRQLALTVEETRGVLATRFHHAVCDGVGGLLWLQHQLEVASGQRAPTVMPARYITPVLQRHPAPAKRSVFAFRGPSHRLAAAPAPPSRARRWQTVTIEMAPLQEVVARAGDVTYNDVLATCALETFLIWSQRASGVLGQRASGVVRRVPAKRVGASGALSRYDGGMPRIGLWMPVNIREEPLAGFGNGTSRVRVYARYGSSGKLLEKCRAVRRHMIWSRQHGEWAVPEMRAMRRLPMRILGPLLRAYFGRPWVDMGTGSLSHIERSPLDAPAFANVVDAEFIGPLDVRHPLGLYALSRMGVTRLSFVYDPAQLDAAAIAQLVAMFQEQLAAVVAESA